VLVYLLNDYVLVIPSYRRLHLFRFLTSNVEMPSVSLLINSTGNTINMSGHLCRTCHIVGLPWSKGDGWFKERSK
jgi:hypothetical protein